MTQSEVRLLARETRDNTKTPKQLPTFSARPRSQCQLHRKASIACTMCIYQKSSKRLA